MRRDCHFKESHWQGFVFGSASDKIQTLTKTCNVGKLCVYNYERDNSQEISGGMGGGFNKCIFLNRVNEMSNFGEYR